MRDTDSTLGVTVTVNGKAWRLVRSLAGAGPRDREYSLVRTPEGKAVLQFGDGVHGARPPVGGRITVRYRAGAGGSSTTVILKRAAAAATADQDLWVAIRNRSRAISFEFRERRGQRAGGRKP